MHRCYNLVPATEKSALIVKDMHVFNTQSRPLSSLLQNNEIKKRNKALQSHIKLKGLRY